MLASQVVVVPHCSTTFSTVLAVDRLFVYDCDPPFAALSVRFVLGTHFFAVEMVPVSRLLCLVMSGLPLGFTREPPR